MRRQRLSSESLTEYLFLRPWYQLRSGGHSCG